MHSSWWHYRQWRFLADMNGDGALNSADMLLWAQWLFFLPGDALIAQFGATPLGRLLELTPASLGSPTSAAISAALWLAALGLVLWLPGFLHDIVDPTYRQEKRERRRALRERKRQARSRRRWLFRRRAPLEPQLRREPQLSSIEPLAAAADPFPEPQEKSPQRQVRVA